MTQIKCHEIGIRVSRKVTHERTRFYVSDEDHVILLKNNVFSGKTVRRMFKLKKSNALL